MEKPLVTSVMWEDATDILGIGDSIAKCPTMSEALLHSEEMSHVAPAFQVLPLTSLEMKTSFIMIQVWNLTFLQLNKIFLHR